MQHLKHLISQVQKYVQKHTLYKVFLFGFFTALLFVLSFPPYSVWPLAFVCLVPFLVMLFRLKSFKEAFCLGFSTMVSLGFMGFSWISSVATNFGGLPWIVGKLVLLLFSMFGELEFVLFAIVGYFFLSCIKDFKKNWKKLLLILFSFPTLFVAIDFVYPKIFPNTLGHALYGWFEVAQLAEVSGVYGLSFLVLVINVGIVLILCDTKKIFLAAFIVGTIFFLGTAHLWGLHRIQMLQDLQNSYTRKFRFSVIQANIGDLEKLASEQGVNWALTKVLTTYRAMSLQAVQQFNPELVIWPETAYPYIYTHFTNAQANRLGTAKDQWIADFMSELNKPLLFGTYSMMGGRDFNSLFLIGPQQQFFGLYQKSILLVFGEYVPLGWLNLWIQKLIPSIADFGRGKGAAVLELHGTKFGPQICYEGIYSEHSRQSVKLGAEVLMNITNDSWFGNTAEPWLHLVLTAFRSIELRRPLIRATNTGVSAVIDITGKINSKTNLFEDTILNDQVLLPEKKQAYQNTFYLKYGEWFAWVCVVTGLVLLLGVFWIGQLRLKVRKNLRA